MPNELANGFRDKKERHPDTAFKRHIKKFYALSVEDFERKWNEQNGCCCICGVAMVRGSMEAERSALTTIMIPARCVGFFCSLCNQWKDSMKIGKTSQRKR